MTARGLVALIAVASVLALAPIARAEPPATVAGTVVDDTGAPAAGVVVLAGPALSVTDDAGRFEATLPAGTHVVELTAPWLAPLSEPVTLAPGERRAITFRMTAADEATGEVITVEETAPVEPTRTTITAADARKVPGTSGDALKVVQSLPGVARPSPGSADVVVWGAASEDTQVLVDGVPLPALYHVGGWRAVFAGELVDRIELRPGAFGAEYGDAIGGIVTIDGRLPDRDDGAVVAIDLLDAGGAAWTRVGPARVALAARASYLDRVVRAAAGDVGALVPIPQWADAQLVAELPARGGTVRATMLGSLDRLDRVVDSDDPAAVKRQRQDRRFARAIVGWSGPAAGGSARVTGWIGLDHDRLEQRFGEVPAELRADTPLGGLRATHTAALGDAVVLTLGVDGRIADARLSRRGSLGTPAREGDVSIFGQPPGDDVASDAWRARVLAAAPFVTADWIAGRLTLSPGLRLEADVLTSSATLPIVGTSPRTGWQHIDARPEPRLAARVRLGRVTASADLGVHHQRRAASDASAVFGTPVLTHERALHAAAGAAVTLGPASLELVAYGRRLDDLVARAPSPTPPPAAALTQDGTGRVLGAQLVARLRGWRDLVGWIAYGISRSERRDAPGQPLRLFDHDQTHLVTAVAGWQRGPWSLGTRLRVASGEPRTAVVGAFVDARAGRYQPIVGPTNGIRLPVFVQLDLRGERTWRLGGGTLALSLEVQNLTSRANAEELVYSADYADRDYLTGLPILAVVGARWEH